MGAVMRMNECKSSAMKMWAYQYLGSKYGQYSFLHSDLLIG